MCLRLFHRIFLSILFLFNRALNLSAISFGTMNLPFLLIHISSYDKIEYQANYFALAFLLPLETFNKEVISSSIDSFILLKKRWNVSISAMIKRCQISNILTDNQIRYLNSQMIKYGYYRKEPLDEEIKKEKPYLFKQAFQILLDNNIFTREALLEKLELNKNEAIEIYSLDESFFIRKDNILKLIK